MLFNVKLILFGIIGSIFVTRVDKCSTNIRLKATFLVHLLWLFFSS